MVQTTDEFDEAVAYLTEHPEDIPLAWRDGAGRHQNQPGRCLFRFAKNYNRTSTPDLGCITMIRSGVSVSAWADLTKRIREDSRLPSNDLDIKVHHLPVFAEYQREISARIEAENSGRS